MNWSSRITSPRILWLPISLTSKLFPPTSPNPLIRLKPQISPTPSKKLSRSAPIFRSSITTSRTPKLTFAPPETLFFPPLPLVLNTLPTASPAIPTPAHPASSPALPLSTQTVTRSRRLIRFGTRSFHDWPRSRRLRHCPGSDLSQ